MDAVFEVFEKMIQLSNGQYWYYPATNELELPQATDSSCLVFANRPDSPSPNGRTGKQSKLRNARKTRTKRSLALTRCR